MNDNQCFKQTEEVPLTLCKVSEMSQLSGLRKRALRRYDRIGLLHPEVTLESGRRLYTRDDLIRLERLAMMQMLGLARSEIKNCLGSEDRELLNELRLQREILVEKRRRLSRIIYFLEYAEEVNRDPESGDWHYLGKVVEAIQWLRDPEWFKRFYIRGNMHEKGTAQVEAK
jgi:DNA-binding transcriptional MerR regulator